MMPGKKKKAKRPKGTIGAGSYGQVRKEGSVAIKKFDKETHLLAEYSAMKHLEGCKYVVHAIGYDIRKLELTMQLYNRGSLRQYLRDYSVPDDQISGILRDILRGLVELHANGLAHADLRPSNVLVMAELNRNGTYDVRAVLGDLGFTSLARYSKCDRTAASHRPIDIHPGPEHDMFSFGIILLEILGGVRLGQQKNYQDLTLLTDKAITDPGNKRLVLALLQPDRTKRPSAATCLSILFGEVYHPYIIGNDRLSNLVSEARTELNKADDRVQYVRDKFDELCSKITKVVNCRDRGKLALAILFKRDSLTRRNHRFYSLVMIMLLTGVFGPKGLKFARVVRCFKYVEDKDRLYEPSHIYEALDRILQCADVRLLLLGRY